MKRHQFSILKQLILFAVICILSTTTACTLSLSQEPETQPTSESGSGGIPVAVLTEAAATIHAQLQQTFAQQAPIQPGLTLTSPATQAAPGIIFTQTAPGVPLNTPTPTFTLMPTATTTATATNIPSTPTSTNTLSAYTPVPTDVRVLRSGTYFYVDNVNIHWCSGVPWSIFMIYNAGVNNLESISLYILNVSTGKSVYGPVTRNTPFITSDKICNNGSISSLASGGTLFTGASLSNLAKKGQTLRATIKACSADGLAGSCTQKTVQFVFP